MSFSCGLSTVTCIFCVVLDKALESDLVKLALVNLSQQKLGHVVFLILPAAVVGKYGVSFVAA